MNRGDFIIEYFDTKIDVEDENQQKNIFIEQTVLCFRKFFQLIFLNFVVKKGFFEVWYSEALFYKNKNFQIKINQAVDVVKLNEEELISKVKEF